MIVGIDVGGTHTDGVLIKSKTGSRAEDDYEIFSTSKVVTDQADLMGSIVNALDNLICGEENKEIKRIVLSTTLATNAILEEKYDPVGLILIPGPGLNPEYLKYGDDNFILSGYINHRGHQVKSLDEDEVFKGLGQLESHDIKNVGVIGKFSIRNPEQEEKVIEIINDNSYSFQVVTAGHQLSGRLNFPRRVVTAYFNSAVTPLHQGFIKAIKEALKARKIKAEVFLLKCDGGTIPLEKSVGVPVQTVNSGPAASIMGVMTLGQVGQQKETAISLDIGGTTTDIGLFIDGEPVFMPEGIAINGLPTLVRGLYSVSIPLGGDSQISVEKGCLQIGPQRSGPAAACGGPAPTPTDALLILGYIGDDQDYEKNFDLEAARQSLSSLSTKLNPLAYKGYLRRAGVNKDMLSVDILAEIIIDQMTDTIVRKIREILHSLENRPVYTISELLNGSVINPQLLLGMGGPAKALVKILAKKLRYQAELIPYAKVANAIGAAFARPTLGTTVRVDTATAYLDVVEAGIHRRLRNGEVFNIYKAEELAVDWTRKRAENQKIVVEITDKESFNVIRGFRTLGEIMEVKAQIKPGPIARIERGESIYE